MKNILITGSEGIIASVIIPTLTHTYQVFKLDKLSSNPHTYKEDISDRIQLDILFAKLPNIDAIIHLAGISDPKGSWEEILAHNIIGTKNIYEMAHKFSIKKVVYASSNLVMRGYQLDGQHNISITLPVRPNSYYAVSKVFGEAIARMYYENFGIRSICLRIGTVNKYDDPTVSESSKRKWLSHADTIQVFEKALDSDIEFGVFYATSANSDPIFELAQTITKLNYHPKDGYGKT